MKTWADVVAAATAPAPKFEAGRATLGSPARGALRTAVVLVERGDLTREQALCALALGLLDVNERQHEMIVESISMTPRAPWVISRDGLGLE